MKTSWTFVFGFVAALCLAKPAFALFCGCVPIPAEGSYGNAAGEALLLTHENGNETECPTLIRMNAIRQGGQNVDAVLACDIPTNTWSGEETMAGVGKFFFELIAIKPQNNSPGPEVAEQIDASLRMSEEIALEIIIPGMGRTIGKSDRNVKPTHKLAGATSAAPCICSQVRDELAAIRDLITAYSDPNLIADAAARNLPAKKSDAEFWMDDSGLLHEFPQTDSELAYEDLVYAQSDGIEPGNAKSQAALNAEGPGSSDLEVGAFAQTDVFNCDITAIDAADVVKECTSDVVIEAAYAHESVHRAKCEELNKPGVYTAPDNTTLNWKNPGISGRVYYKGIEYPASAFSAWSERPQNNSKDEIDAYSAEVSILEAWLASSCQ